MMTAMYNQQMQPALKLELTTNARVHAFEHRGRSFILFVDITCIFL